MAAAMRRGKEIKLKPQLPKSNALPEPKDPVEIQAFFKWHDIVFIESYNKNVAGSGNNNALLHSTQPDKGFMMRGSLDAIEKGLPDHFVRFSQSLLVNFHKVTGRIKGGTSYLKGEQVFKITDTYKGKAMEKIARLAADGGRDFP